MQLGADAEWDLANILRAAAVNALRGGNWQRGNAGAKNPTPPPEPIGPPSMQRQRKSRGDAMPIGELRAEIERRQRAPAVRKG
jgi:hypothetical protein